jgi:hypothetical protein
VIGLNVLLWLFIGLFTIIGYARGYKRELLVSSSVILAIYIITIFESYIPFIRDTMVPNPGGSIFWMRMGIFGFLVFFGYQTPSIPRAAINERFQIKNPQDSIIGLVVGALNGYFLFGTFWFFLDAAKYPIPFISSPDIITKAGATFKQIVFFMPPAVLASPVIYFVVAIALTFILIVFI